MVNVAQARSMLKQLQGGLSSLDANAERSMQNLNTIKSQTSNLLQGTSTSTADQIDSSLGRAIGSLREIQNSLRRANREIDSYLNCTL